MLGVGLYGDNGHQVQRLLENHPKAQLVAVSQFANLLPYAKNYDSLEEMLQDNSIELICLCSPKRSEQAEQAIKCMRAGKHVYAEKPCALTEEELNQIIETARDTGMVFHEMAGTAFIEPYLSMGEIVKSGKIGEVVQVFVQKSYPYHPGRPQDESVDGGLICQAGIHALRLIEHTAGVKIKEICAIETSFGNPVAEGGLQMASAMMMTLQNGGIASVAANYLNQAGHGVWGNDHLRIFGSKGFVESVDGGRRTRLVIGEEDLGEIKTRENTASFFDMLVDSLVCGGEMPFCAEEELSPTRMVIRAKRSSHLQAI